MKILVIQLTRFGDILCTLPALSALRREKPDAEIHFMVRKKFAAAAEGLAGVDHLWRFDTQGILKHFIGGSRKVSDGATELGRVVGELRAEKFDLIINLSFSPSSSYLAHLISRNSTPVVGYTRTSDFFLHVPDFPSQYFRGQVGVDKSNRIHVTDVMGWIAGVRIKDSDWIWGAQSAVTPRAGIVCHLGASQSQKTWPEGSWVGLLQKLNDQEGEKIFLVGSVEERPLAEKISGQIFNAKKIENLVGCTSFADLKTLTASAKLFIGADSGPMHVASFSGTPVLNLSVGRVRFWETGPTSRGSRILVSENPELLGSDLVFNMAREILNGIESKIGYIGCAGRRGIRYDVYPQGRATGDFWPLVDWLYFDGPQPSYGGEVQKALAQICEVCEISCAQLEIFYKNPQKVEVVGVLDRLDEIIEMFRVHIRPLTPLLDGFKVQKENVAPGSREEIFYQTKNCYTELRRRAQRLSGHDFETVKGQNP